MTSLPSEAEMRKLFHLGLRDTEVAQEHGVTRQAVQKRWRSLGLYRQPFTQEVKDLLAGGFDISPGATKAGSSQNQWASKCLRLVLRRRLGDALSERQMEMARRWLGWMEEQHVIVSYTDDLGWHYLPRQPSDRPWLVRWPTDKPLPSSRHQKALTMGSELDPVDE